MPDLILSAEQKTALTQKSIQNIEILQMGIQELENYINTLTLENPVITQDSPAPDSTEDSIILPVNTEDFSPHVSKKEASYSSDFSGNVLQNIPADTQESLEDAVKLQLIPYFHTHKDKSVLTFLAESLTDHGYLLLSAKELSTIFSISEAESTRYIQIIRNLEPCGIGASDLKDCLLLQLNCHTDQTAALLSSMIQEHMDLILNQQYTKLAELYHTDTKKISQAYDLLRTLNPNPGNGFSSHEKTVYIVPDVIILQKHNHFLISLNQDLRPGIQISEVYRSFLTHPDKEVRDYLYQKFQQAEWINHCIEQRNQTLLTVTRQLLINQKAFFLHGPDHLKPLRQADLASQLNLNASTISRAIRDKYLECFWGVFPLKYFFHKSVSAVSDNTTPAQLMKRISQLIEKEDPAHPLSDQKIATFLQKEGIPTSRRTIAKYRTQLGIPDTSRRRIH